MFRRDEGEAVDPEAGLAARAAWLSYVGGYRQEDIAERLHVSRVKVNRLIAKAHRQGMVRVFVEGTAADCVALEDELARRFGLKFALVAPNLNGGDLPLATLGNAGSRFLHSVLEDGPDLTIGVGHGRTIASVVDNLPRVSRPGVRFVSLLGGIVRNAVANPFDIIHRLGERTGGETYFMPVPFVADSVADKAVLTAQRSLREVFDLAAETELCIVGIGELSDNAFMRLSGMVSDADFRELREAGAVGEVLGEFLDGDGRPLDVDVNRRSIGLKLDDLRGGGGRRVVAIAGGSGKVEAIGAVLRTGVITGLITDEVTARSIVAGTG
jgi:DNA-binding transcriptional regulator LsrR (DeoR family)